MTEQTVLPQLRTLSKNASPLPLEHTSVQTSIVGLAATVNVSQRFRNPLRKKGDLEYLFPLPHKAAVTTFELRSGERVITASVHELEQAVRQFENARQSGKRAGLLDTRRPNLFALQLANILPGEFIEAVITYQEQLEYSAGRVEYVFPMGLAPKYHRPGHPEEAQGVDAPVTLDRSQVGDVEISIQLDAGIPCGEPGSPSHPIRLSQAGGQRFALSLDGAHIPDHDFVLRWNIPDNSLQFPTWCVPGDKGYFMSSILPPSPKAEAVPLPLEYIFVLDRSGSMTGDPLRQAINALKACLRSLNPGDTFGILLFDNQLEWLATVTRVTQAAIDQYDQLLSKVFGRGGTEIMSALKAALTLESDAERARLVIFLTDGEVSAESAAFSLLRKQIGRTRLFTFGIGPSVNRAFLEQLAKLGAGQAEFIGLNEDIEEAILRFQDRISFPMITNLTLRAEGGHIWDMYPNRLPDLYYGVPLEVVGRCLQSGDEPLTLIACGEWAGETVEMRAVVSEQSPDAALLPRLWARARVDELLELAEIGSISQAAARDEVIPLALAHNLLTKYTAFLAIDNQAAAMPGKSNFIQVSHPLPQGLDAAGFFAPRVSSVSSAYSVQPAAMEVMDTPAFLRNRHMATPPAMAKAASPARKGGVSSLADDIDLPTVPNRARVQREFSPKPIEPVVDNTGLEPDNSTPGIDPNQVLQELARTQKLDGSWGEDVELTSAALIAFARNGHTTARGHFRKQVARAFSWLTQASAQGFPAFFRAQALQELASATQLTGHLAAAEDALRSLPEPATNLEAVCAAALSQTALPAKQPKRVDNMDQLRLVAVTNAGRIKVAPELVVSELGRVLVACILG